MTRKLRIALAVNLLALAAVSVVDTASADWFDDFEAATSWTSGSAESAPGFRGGSAYFNGGGFMYGCPCP